jgi:predicted nucleic acid-binding protein
MAKTPAKEQMKTVLLDTCFLIALVAKDSPFHNVAKTYDKYFLTNHITMFIPTIVASEFNQLATIAPLIQTGNYRHLPFSYKDALAVGEVAFHLGLTTRGVMAESEDGEKRAEIKDDIKILGQAKQNNIDYLITSDDGIFKRCERLRKSDVMTCTPIHINTSFDSSVFNDLGQTNILDTLS